jgi:transcriptional regulator GlxA family with amidase domain
VIPRCVQMLFGQEGTTFSTHVRAMRLDLARRMLCDPAHAHRRVGDIALDAGFSDISNFNRAFRQRHGRTPTEARSEAADRKPR